MKCPRSYCPEEADTFILGGKRVTGKQAPFCTPSTLQFVWNMGWKLLGDRVNYMGPSTPVRGYCNSPSMNAPEYMPTNRHLMEREGGQQNLN